MATSGKQPAAPAKQPKSRDGKPATPAASDKGKQNSTARMQPEIRPKAK